MLSSRGRSVRAEPTARMSCACATQSMTSYKP
jgi:hypothetical protein